MAEQNQIKDDQARSVGRGVLAIGMAKLYFIFTGLIVQFGLPRLLKWVLMRDGMSLDAATPAAQAMYGDYKLVNNTVSQLNNTVVTGTIQTVSKFTAEREHGLGIVKRRALVLQLCIGGGLALAYALSASFLASLQLGKDETGAHQSLTTAMRISALIVLAYAFYALFIGVLNGQRKFLAQATFDISYSTLRPAAILGAAAAGLGVLGIFGAFATAAALICIAAALVVGPLSGPKDEALSFSEIARAGAGIFFYTLLFNLLLFEDAQLLRPLVAYGVDGATQDLSTLLGRLSGIYGAVQNIGFVPYQLVIAVTFVVFPLVSKATFEHDLKNTQLYIFNALRYSVILLAVLLGAILAAPRGLVVLPHGAEYAVGGAALRALGFGQFCFSLLAVSNTILLGAGKIRLAAESVLLALITQAIVAFFLVPAAAKGEDILQAPLIAAAISSTIGISVGLTRALLALRKEFQAILPLATLLRGMLLIAACIALGVFFPEGGAISTLLHAMLGAAVVVFGFAITREFNAEDKARFANVLRRKAS
jgi:O-antigen/teichoic acid export membrane protein